MWRMCDLGLCALVYTGFLCGTDIFFRPLAMCGRVRVAKQVPAMIIEVTNHIEVWSIKHAFFRCSDLWGSHSDACVLRSMETHI